MKPQLDSGLPEDLIPSRIAVPPGATDPLRATALDRVAFRKARAPLDYLGNPYTIDPESCTLVAHKRIRWD